MFESFMPPAVFMVACLAFTSHGRRLQSKQGWTGVVKEPITSARAFRANAAHASAGKTDRLQLFKAALEGKDILDYMQPEDEFPGDELADGGDEDGLRLIRAAVVAASGPRPPAPQGGTVKQLAASWGEHYFDEEEEEEEEEELGQHNVMVADETRNSWFREAISRRLRGTTDRVVLDVGTGPFCLFACFAARAGAHRVYAVEANPVAAKMARTTVEQAEAANLVPTGVIKILEGSSTEVSLPERVDLVIAEIVGELATAEGIVCTMRDVQARHLKRPHDPTSYIPQRVQTWCAPASYVVPSLLRPPYSSFDFAKELGEAPMHVGPNNPGFQLLSQPQLLEDLELFRPLPPLGCPQTLNFSFVIESGLLAGARDAYSDVFEDGLKELGCQKKSIRQLVDSLAHSMAGLACWPRLLLDGSLGNDTEGLGSTLVVDSRNASIYGVKREDMPLESHWDTSIPLLSPRPLRVGSGDSVQLKYAVEYGTHINTPTRYDFQGELLSAASDAKSGKQGELLSATSDSKSGKKKTKLKPVKGSGKQVIGSSMKGFR
mmetsp:Transcript_144244/g.251437  ORF Transcript_144244/g.251437 Transcript_144244/m.251437 type:complete len:548 (+) Transcript_144244:61-1704(+)